MRLVEMVDESEAPVVERRPESSPPEDGAVPELVEECIRELDEADVASDSGAPTCRKVLRGKGFADGNDVIASAVRDRKMRAP